MAKVIKETIISQNENPYRVGKDPSRTKATPTQTIEYLVYFICGILEILLTFRLLFKLTGASTGSAFTSFIYSITRIFILPFEGIFHRGFAEGVETTAVLEPSTLVALVVYAVLAWIIVKFIRIISGEHPQTE